MNQTSPRTIRPAELSIILEKHKRHLETSGKEGEVADLSYAVLDRVNFNGALLRGALLNAASLRSANLSNCDLSRAEIEQSDLTDAQLRKATLHHTKLGGSTLDHAILIGADCDTAEFSDCKLRRAYFDQARLQRVDFSNSDLEGASFVRSDLAMSDVSGATLKDANFRDANLTSVEGLTTGQLIGTDLTGADLPAGVANFVNIEILNETSKNARKLFFSLLLGCAYSGLTIATTTDGRLLANTVSSPLPLIGTEIPIAGFYWVAPILLVASYLYLHFYLRRLWEGFSELPYRFQDGKRLDQRVYPWILNSIIGRHFALGKSNRTVFNRWEEWASIFLAWWVLPLTVILFWLRYLPRHDWVGTGIHVVLTSLSMLIGMSFYREMARTLGGTVRKHSGLTSFFNYPRVLISLAVLLSLVLFFGLSLGAIEGVRNHEMTRDLRTWVPWVSRAVFKYDVFASLSGQEVSKIPVSYWQLPPQERNNAVLGADMRNADLRYSSAAGAFLVKARLGGAALRRAAWFNANLQEANFVGSDLTGAHLNGADLRGAHFMNATLWKAELPAVDASGAEFGPANLISVDLRKANLSGARFGPATALCGANLERANRVNPICS